MSTSGGLAGNGGNLSITTERGGGGTGGSVRVITWAGEVRSASILFSSETILVTVLDVGHWRRFLAKDQGRWRKWRSRTLPNDLFTQRVHGEQSPDNLTSGGGGGGCGGRTSRTISVA